MLRAPHAKLPPSVQKGSPIMVPRFCMFTKRKYHRGRRRSGKWIFGGVCRETGECFLSIVPDRGENTLLPILQKYVEKETAILSDCWKGYFNIEKLNSNYDHWTVNHSKYFKDPVTGVHTNTMREPGLMRREVCQSLALIKSC